MLDQPFAQVARWLGATAVTTMICASAAQAQPGGEADYSLPAQELARSLREVAVRSRVSVIAPSDLVAGRRAPPLRGRYAARQAVEALLHGSGLRVTIVGDALVVNRADPSPVTADSSEPQARESDPIIVTGTNLRGAQPTSPVIVIRREDIAASGSNSVEQLMGKLPQNSQNGVNRENVNVVGAGADPTEHGAGLNLRGLGQRATLVLINGRRVAPSNGGSFVDISLIPLDAIERVEVVTDGASAIYGSDAVGGVVNFILRDDFEGVETQLLAGSATEGDGDVLQAGATAGARWGSGRAMLSYEYRAEDPILARDRDFTINLVPDTALLPRERRHTLFGNLSQDLAEGLRAELTGSFATRDTDRSFFFAGSPVPVSSNAQAQTITSAANLRYAIGSDWALQLSGGFSETRTSERQEQTGGLGLINDRSTRNAIADLSLKLDGSLFDMPAGPVRIALGAEGRREWYREDFRTQTIALPVEEARNVAAAFVEAQLPLFSSLNRRPGLERLTLTAAARYEHYDGFGSTFDPKLGLLWSPVVGLTLRTSYDTSFRAPLLSETAGAYSAIYVPAALVFIDPSQGQGVGLVLGGSNPDVSPERSRSWTIGGEFAPRAVPGLSLSLNYYAIRFSDRIALPSPIITVVGDPAFDSIVTRDPDDALVQDLIAGAQAAVDFSGPGFTNGHATPADVTVIVDGRVNNTAISKTRGLDANLRYGFAVGENRFVLNANLNYIFSFTDQLRPTSPVIRALDTPYRPLNLRLRGQFGWNRAGWSANLFVNHAGGYRDTRGGRSLSIGSYTTFDLSLAYDFGREGGPGWLRGTRVALGADNLFDRDPPRLLPDPGSTVGYGYDPVNASGRGRFVSLQIRKVW
jgi:iron complex outermembrane recepter protein